MPSSPPRHDGGDDSPRKGSPASSRSSSSRSSGSSSRRSSRSSRYRRRRSYSSSRSRSGGDDRRRGNNNNKRGRSPPTDSDGDGEQNHRHNNTDYDYTGRRHYNNDNHRDEQQQQQQQLFTIPSAAQALSLVVEPSSFPSNAYYIQVPTHLPLALTTLIDLVASFVASGGPSAEEAIAMREAHNPFFAFLRLEWHAAPQLYYRWRLYSLLQGDSLTQWRTRPFQMEVASSGGGGGDEQSCASSGGCYVWIPPPMTTVASVTGVAAAPSPSVGAVGSQNATTELPLTEAQAVHCRRGGRVASPSSANGEAAEGTTAPKSFLSVLSQTGPVTSSSSSSSSSAAAAFPPLPMSVMIGVRKQRLAAMTAMREATKEMGRVVEAVLCSAADDSDRPSPTAAAAATPTETPAAGSSAFDDIFGDFLAETGSGSASTMASTKKPEKQPGDGDDDTVATVDDLLRVTRKEAMALCEAFFPQQKSTNNSPYSYGGGGANGAPPTTHHSPFLVPFLPTPSRYHSAPSPFLYMRDKAAATAEGGDAEQQEGSSETLLPSVSSSSSLSSAAADPSSFVQPSIVWIAKALGQRERALCAFMTKVNTQRLEGFVDVRRIRHDTNGNSNTINSGGGEGEEGTIGGVPIVPLPTAVTSYTQHFMGGSNGGSGSSAAPRTLPFVVELPRYVTSNLNVLGRVRATAMLYAMRRGRRTGDGLGIGSSCPSFKDHITGASVVSSIEALLGSSGGAPNDTDAGAVAPLRQAVKAIVEARYGAGVALADLMRYVFAAYGYVFVADTISSSDPTTASSPEDDGPNSSSAADNTERFHRIILQRAVLDRSFITDVSATLLQFGRAAHHAASLLLDEANRAARLPLEAMGLVRFIVEDVLKSDAMRALLLHAATASTDASSDQHRRAVATAVAMLSAIPDRLTAVHTYSLQSLLFILNDVVLMTGADNANGAASAAAASGNGHDGSSNGSTAIANSANTPNQSTNAATAIASVVTGASSHLSATLWVDVRDVAPTAAAPNGLALAERASKTPLPPFTAPNALSLQSAAAAQHSHALHERQHVLNVNAALCAVSTTNRRMLLHAVELIMPSVIEVVAAYVGSVANRGATTTSTGKSPAATTTTSFTMDINTDASSNNGGGGSLLNPNLVVMAGTITDPSLSSPSSNDSSDGGGGVSSLMAAQLLVWLRTLLFEWSHAKAFSGRRYQMLASKYPFLAQ